MVHGFGQRSRALRARLRPRRLRHLADDPRERRSDDGRDRDARELRARRQGVKGEDDVATLRNGDRPAEVRGLPGVHGRVQRRVGRPGRIRAHARAGQRRSSGPFRTCRPAPHVGAVQPLRPATLRRGVPDRARRHQDAGRHRARRRRCLHRLRLLRRRLSLRRALHQPAHRRRSTSATSAPRASSAESSPRASRPAPRTPSTSATSRIATARCTAWCSSTGRAGWRPATVAVGPNVYYLGRPEHLDLVLTQLPAAGPRGSSPPAKAWTKLLKPLVLALVGATFAGQAVAFFNQLRKGEDDFED